jgi:hypothetical protein
LGSWGGFEVPALDGVWTWVGVDGERWEWWCGGGMERKDDTSMSGWYLLVVTVA